MAAAINDVEQNGFDIRETARRYGMSDGHILAAQVFIDSAQFFIISTLKNYACTIKRKDAYASYYYDLDLIK